MSELIKELEPLLNTKITLRTKYPGKDEKVVTGTVKDYRKAMGVITNQKTGEAYQGFQLKIKPDDGSRAFWSIAFPLKDKEATV